MQHLLHPPRAFAALRALAATFLRVEPRGPQGQTNHASRFIDDHHAARAQQRSFRREGIEIHAHVAFFRPKNRNRRTAGNHAFQLVAIPKPAALLIDQFHERDAKLALNNRGLIDVAADTVKFRPRVLLVRTDAFEPIDASSEDVRKIRKCLDIVDNSRTAV